MVENEIVEALSELENAVERKMPVINRLGIKDIICCCDMSEMKKAECLTELYYYWRKLYKWDYYSIVKQKEAELFEGMHGDFVDSIYCDYLWPSSSVAYDRWYNETKFSKMH